jgi:hypothetical protein
LWIASSLFFLHKIPLWNEVHRGIWRALNAEAENLGFEPPDFIREELEDSCRYSRGSSWRRELVNEKGKSKSIFRDLKTGRFIKKP